MPNRMPMSFFAVLAIYLALLDVLAVQHGQDAFSHRKDDAALSDQPIREQGHAVHAGHLQVREHELRALGGEHRERLLAALGGHHLEAFLAQFDAQALLPPPSQEHLAKLRGRVKRLDKLLDDLLAYSRAGRTQYHAETLDTRLLLENLIELLNPPPGFTITIADEMPTIVTERVPLETLLRNLLSNAIKHHHEPSEGRVHIAAQVQGAWATFAVTDNGPGIDPAFHERIFQLFQTLRPRDQVEGSGIGLAVVKKTVESYGGTVEIDSNIGQGTTIRFTWPVG